MYLIKIIISHFWIPILILIFSFIFLKRLNIQNLEAGRIVFGIVLGVVLGFGADIAKRSYDDLIRERKLKKAAMKLLEEDAKEIYRTIWLWDRFMKSPEMPEEAKRIIPAELNLKYWNRLKENNDFLMLAAEEPFTSIFKEMWKFEEINQQISLAKSGDSIAGSFAVAFYKMSADEGLHRKLLLLFMSEQEINTLDEKHIRASEEKFKR